MRSFLLRLTSLSAAALAATSTESTSATCVTSSASSTDTATWTIDYALVNAPVTGTGYDIDSSFVAAYGFNNTMQLSITHDSNATDYASFKCQFACNGNQGCVAFFGRFIDVNTDEESFECLSFNTLLDESSFTTSTSNMAVGGFNKLCS